MKLFLDTADINEIAPLYDTGLVDGITTNPTLIAKTGKPMKQVIKEICDLVDGPVSAEVKAMDTDGIVKEASILRDVADNVVIKVPLTFDGLKATHELSSEGVPVNVTLCFSPGQALLAAKAGAAYVSPFVGRLDDLGNDGLKILQDITETFSNVALFEDSQTAILAASIRSVQQVVEATKMGCDVATISAKIFNQLFQHPLTDKGLEIFNKDWETSGQSIV